MKYKLVMLAAMGLASMYMMHLLAMDYMRIQRIMAAAQKFSPAIANAARIIFRGKRDLPSEVFGLSGKLNFPSSEADGLSLSTTETIRKIISTSTTTTLMPPVFNLSPEEAKFLDNFKDNLKFNWDAILRMDLLKCSQSLICQITAGAVKNETIAENIEMVIKFSYHMAPYKVKDSYIKGLKNIHSPEKCYGEYPFCVYSAGTMIKILKWFLKFVGDSER